MDWPARQGVGHWRIKTTHPQAGWTAGGGALVFEHGRIDHAPQAGQREAGPGYLCRPVGIRFDHDPTGDDRGALAGKARKPGYKTASICAILPRDTEFTAPDLLAILESADDGRAWDKKTVSNLMGELRRRGLIRRTRRASAGIPAVYVRTDPGADPPRISEMPLAKAAQAVLTRPMNLAELCVALVEAGYRTRQPSKGFRHSVGVELRRGLFRRLRGGSGSEYSGG